LSTSSEARKKRLARGRAGEQHHLLRADVEGGHVAALGAGALEELHRRPHERDEVADER
jgi:hypothetical protein